MDYKGVECPVCKNRFTENDDIVVCPECGTPHHRECWFSVSHCANEDRHSDGFVFEMPRIKQIEKRLEEELSSREKSDIPEQMNLPNDGQTGSDQSTISAPILGGLGQLGMDFGVDAKIADIPVNEAVAFVGEDSSSLKLLLKMAFVDKFKTARINFVALLFPYLWFFYRKMYKTGMLVIALMLVVTAVFSNANTVRYQKELFGLYMQALRSEITVEEYNAKMIELQEKGTGNSSFYEYAPQFINMAIRIVFALLANKLYLEHMKKQVLKAREECSSMDEYMAALRRKGGKSVGAAILSVIGVMVLQAGLNAVLYLIYR